MAAVFYALSTLKAKLAEADKERGATAVEYGLLVALIAAVIIGVVVTLGTEIQGAFQEVVTGIQEAGGE